MKITEKLKNERIFLDGGMGTMLQERGLAAGEPPEIWNITHPDVIFAIHEEYFKAGCDIASTNTFGVNSLKYDRETLENMISLAVSSARLAASKHENKYVALDIGPLGKLLKPYGDLPFEKAVEIFKSTISYGVKCGVDLILIETMNDSYETKAAVLAAKECCELPIFVSNVYDETSKLMTGADIGAMVAMLEGLDVDAIGMNCSLGPAQMLDILDDFLSLSSLPIIVTPNAGLPKSVNGAPVYDVSSQDFALEMKKIALKGAHVLGGCCGTTPEYMHKTIEIVQDVPYIPTKNKDICCVSSYTHAVKIGDDPIIIAERINPTGKPLLKKALRENDMDFILKEALTQEEHGSHILDVNVGLPEIDEAEMMKKIIFEIQSVCDLPLQIDTVDAFAMEQAMRIYNGKPLINSVSGKEQSMSEVFPLVKKYGGAVIALTLDEKGIPTTAKGRFEIAKRIVERAESYGIDKKNIIVDPLALTVSSDPFSARTTLESISLIKNELKVKTSLGVSNISFGLPQRDNLTSSFYTMALAAGLDCAIMNPCSDEMKKAYYSYLALSGNDPGFEKYIAYASNAASSNAQDISKPASTISLKDAVIRGLKEESAAAAKREVQKSAPLDVINNHIIPALNEVGNGFEKKTVFLPQLLMSADSAKAAFEVVKQSIPPNADEKKDTILLATVKGDIHDIGKNIVKVLLENFGFDVVDLGKDVEPQKIVDEAKKRKCKLVGLSALMTTTVPAMEQTIKLLNESCPDTLTVVGGAVLNQEYADMIGADQYCKDAMETVRYAQKVFKR